MKKIVAFLLILIGIYILYRLNEMRLNSRDKKIFTELTGVPKFDMISDIRNARYQYIIARVSPSDKHMMLKQHRYITPPVNLKGNLSYELHSINENDYVYYLEDAGHGYLGYVLYLVSNIDNKVIIYTNYAD